MTDTSMIGLNKYSAEKVMEIYHPSFEAEIGCSMKEFLENILLYGDRQDATSGDSDSTWFEVVE